MGISSNNKRILIILITLGMITVSVLGCGQANDGGQQEGSPNQNTTADEVREDEANGSTEDVPETSIALYPGAQLVHSDDTRVVYSTNASLDDLYNFYRELPEFSTIHGSRAADFVFFLETNLAGILRRVGQSIGSDEAYKEWKAEKDTEISESAAGSILYVVGLQAGSEEVDNAFALDDEIWPLIPQGQNVLYFVYLTE